MASIIEKMKKDLMCPVCHDTLKKPKLLRCSHRLCTECLRDILQDMEPAHIVKCPCCRFEINILTLITKFPQTDSVDFFIDDSPTAESLQDVQTLNTEICVQHNDLCCIYCQDCSTPLCFVCYKQGHMTHRTCSLKEQAESQRLEYQQQLDNYSATLEVLEKGELTEKLFQLKQHYDDAAEAVKREYQKVQTLLMNMEKLATHEISAIRDKEVKEFRKSEKEQVDRMVNHLRVVYNNPSNVAVVSEDVKKQTEELKSKQLPRPKVPQHLNIDIVDLKTVTQCLADITPGIPPRSGESTKIFTVPISNSNNSVKRKAEHIKNEPKTKRVYPPPPPSPCSSSPPNSPVSVRYDTVSEVSD